MDELVTNSGFLHIKEQIFGYFDAPTLANCVLVSKNWNNSLNKSVDLMRFRERANERAIQNVLHAHAMNTSNFET